MLTVARKELVGARGWESRKMKLSEFHNPLLAFATGSGYDIARMKDIVMIRAESNYSRIFLLNGSEVLISKTLKRISIIFSQYQFLRVHQSYLVNFHHLVRVKKGKVIELEMELGLIAYVSRSRRQAVMNRFLMV